MGYLILVKHALPDIRPEIPSPEWRLSDVGRQSCGALAQRLKAYLPAIIVSSKEPKAAETAERVADCLGIPWEVADDLQENDRTGFPYLPPAEWSAAFREFFAAPERLRIGRETANDALHRFDRALQPILGRSPEETIVVVTHGTVISLLVSQRNAVDPYSLWNRLRCPSLVVLSRPEWTIGEIITEM